MDRWFAVGRAEDAPPHHVYHVCLLGTELAVWRDSSGRVNAWENRCPHRGLRLTLGSNIGTGLVCRYHGWRFAAGSGQCTFIPAHPDQTPRDNLHTRPYACREASGLLWVNLTGAAGEPSLAGFAAPASCTGRSLSFPASAEALRDFLVETASAKARDPFLLETEFDTGADTLRLLLLLQPEAASSTRIHSLLGNAPPGGARLPILQRQADWLAGLRRQLEARPAPAAAVPAEVA